MHPNPQFRSKDHQKFEAILSDVAFGAVFLTTPDGPRVAHVPLLSDGSGNIRFHLARNNALTPYLAGARALISVQGPDGYISPRWYDNRDTVPTWDYVALELEGPVTALDDAALEELLHDVIDTFENRIDGERWLASESTERTWSGLFRGITGFAMSVEEWRPTFKLSQKRNDIERTRITADLEQRGNPALARWMREMAP